MPYWSRPNVGILRSNINLTVDGHSLVRTKHNCASSTSSPKRKPTRSTLFSMSSTRLKSSRKHPDAAPKYALIVNDHRGHSASLPLNAPCLDLIFASSLDGTSGIILAHAAVSTVARLTYSPLLADSSRGPASLLAVSRSC